MEIHLRMFGTPMPLRHDDVEKRASVHENLGHPVEEEVIRSRASIFTLTGCYLPGYKGGGPIRSLENLVAVLGGEFHFRIVTLDRDLGDTSRYPNIEVGAWVRVGNSDVSYQRPGLLGLAAMWAALRSVDHDTVLYLNSFFARRFSMFPILLCCVGLCRPRQVVLAPRGEFSPGALALKRRRKSWYLRISRLLGLYDSVIWHASSKYEAADIERELPDSLTTWVAQVLSDRVGQNKKLGLVEIASDLPSGMGVTVSRQRVKLTGKLRAAFVSRVSPKKNLAGGLRVLRGVAGAVSLSIYGPKEDCGYWAECESVIADLPANVRVQYMGEITHEVVGRVFAEHDFFLFPTLGENYGHVICESLVAGCPVLISDRTPWRGLEEAGVGWDLPLEEPERWKEALQRCVDMGEEEHRAMSERAREYARMKIEDPEAVEANRRLFRIAFGLEEMPGAAEAGLKEAR